MDRKTYQLHVFILCYISGQDAVMDSFYFDARTVTFAVSFTEPHLVISILTNVGLRHCWCRSTDLNWSNLHRNQRT